MKYTIFALLAASALAFAGENRNETLRQEVLSSPAAAKKVLADSKADTVLRRTAFRTLLAGKNGDAAAKKGLSDADPVIRTRAVYEIFLRKADKCVPVLKQMVTEKDPQTAKMVLDCAKGIKDQAQSAELMKLLAEKSPVLEVKREAVRIVDFPYYRETKLLRDNPTHDHEVVLWKTVALPNEGWSFKVDPMANGHHKGWFKPDFNDAKWKKLKIGDWESQGYNGYDGIAWYRIRFTMPPKGEALAAEIRFGAVDETAWVWLNGKYAGQHDIGPSGWNKAFDLDITNEVNWGGENVLAVRVEDTTAAGGIWKPVVINLVK